MKKIRKNPILNRDVCAPSDTQFIDQFTIRSTTLVLMMFFMLILFVGFIQNWFDMSDAMLNISWIQSVFDYISQLDSLPLILIFIPIFGGFLQLFYGQRACNSRDRIVIFMTFLTILIVMLLYPVARDGNTLLTLPGVLGLGLSFRIDMLGYTVLLITSIVWFLVMVYAHEYMKKEMRCTRFFFFMAITYSAVLATIMSGDLLTMFLFFEIMTISSYMLVVHGQKDASFKAGYNYIFMGLFGGFLILVAMLLLYSNIGDLRFESAIAKLDQLGSLKYWIMGLLVFGFGIKAGMAPVHVWLPRAHPVAPTPASALLSGIMIKVGAFGILRVSTSYFFPSKGSVVSEIINPIWKTTETVGAAVIWLGIITMAVGVFLALQQANIKKMLAYHSVSQMGYILMGIGVALYLGDLGSMGYTGALYHIINHALFKSLLFMVAGVVYYHTKELDMYKLGGLWKKLPLTTTVCFIAALGISGIPLFNGFISKSILHHSIIEAHHYGHPSFYIAELMFIVVSAATVCSFIKMFYYVFLRKTNNNYDSIVRNYTCLDTSMSALAVFIIGIGIAPKFIINTFIIPMLNTTAYSTTFVEKYIGNLRFFTSEDLITTLIVVVLGVLIFVLGTLFHLFHLRLPRWISFEYLLFYPTYLLMSKTCKLMYGDKCPIDDVSFSKLYEKNDENVGFTERFVITLNAFNRRYESSIIQSDAFIYTGFVTAILIYMLIFGVL